MINPHCEHRQKLGRLRESDAEQHGEDVFA